MKKIVALYKRFSDKRYTTIAGTLVYFLLMSIAPSLLWLALLVGKIDLRGMVSGEVFEAVESILSYLNEAAQNAASGAGVVLLGTSLYSSANFFYHLRRSGEIIYDSDRVKGGLRLRAASVGAVIAAIVCFSAVAAIAISGEKLLSRFFPSIASQAVSLFFTASIAFFIALFLNIFACPARLGFFGATPGSLFTTALWLVFASAFTVYLRFADHSQLYGAAASVIVFLLWCYIMISCLVAGIIYNSFLVAKNRAEPLYSAR